MWSRGNRNVFTAVIGTGKDFIFINDWFPERGTFFNEIDVREAALVCVLGKTVKENLFGSSGPYRRKPEGSANIPTGLSG